MAPKRSIINITFTAFKISSHSITGIRFHNINDYGDDDDDHEDESLYSPLRYIQGQNL